MLTWLAVGVPNPRVYTEAYKWSGGLGIPTANQHNISEKTSYKLFLCSGRGSNLESCDLESDALAIEPPRHPADLLMMFVNDFCNMFLKTGIDKI